MNPSSASSPLTQEQINHLHAFQKTLKPGETIPLNPSNPREKKIIETMLASGGQTRDKYPQVYKALDTSTFDHDTNADKVHLVDAGKTASGKVAATVWSNSNKDTLIKGGNLLAFDGHSGALLGQGENTSVRSGFNTCPIRGATAKPAGKKLDLLYLGHTTEANGSTRFYGYGNSVKTAEVEDGTQATITAPVISHPGNTDVWIAVGRTSGNSNIPTNSDYIYYENQGQGDNPHLIVPFTGNIALSGTIDIESLTADDLATNVIVDNTTGSGEHLNRSTQYTTDQDMVNACSVGSSPNILQWNFPYDSKGYQETASIVYDKGSLTSQKVSYFYFAFNSIPLTDGSTAPPFYVCSKDSPEEPSLNCTKIENLYFWWHCVRKGTLVTLEDGSQVPIEDLNETFRVRTGTNGESFAVSATALGRHNTLSGSEGEKIYRLTTENGKELTALENHIVFMNGERCRMIAYLEPGDSIMTDEGLSKVVSNEIIECDDMFYGLALGSIKETEDPNFPHNKANFYGGGILIGDQLTMRDQSKKAHHDLDFMLPRISEELHVDYSSAVADIRF